jgi:hypothetical protein
VKFIVLGSLNVKASPRQHALNRIPIVVGSERLAR